LRKIAAVLGQDLGDDLATTHTPQSTAALAAEKKRLTLDVLWSKLRALRGDHAAEEAVRSEIAALESRPTHAAEVK
jgi:hypothetical protein